MALPAHRSEGESPSGRESPTASAGTEASTLPKRTQSLEESDSPSSSPLLAPLWPLRFPGPGSPPTSAAGCLSLICSCPHPGSPTRGFVCRPWHASPSFWGAARQAHSLTFALLVCPGSPARVCSLGPRDAGGSWLCLLFPSPTYRSLSTCLLLALHTPLGPAHQSLLPPRNLLGWGLVSPDRLKLRAPPWPRGPSPWVRLRATPLSRRVSAALTVSSLAPCSWTAVSSMLAAACTRKGLVEPRPSTAVQMRSVSSAWVRCFMTSCGGRSGAASLRGTCPRRPRPTWARTPSHAPGASVYEHLHTREPAPPGP